MQIYNIIKLSIIVLFSNLTFSMENPQGPQRLLDDVIVKVINETDDSLTVLVATPSGDVKEHNIVTAGQAKSNIDLKRSLRGGYDTLIFFKRALTETEISQISKKLKADADLLGMKHAISELKKSNNAFKLSYSPSGNTKRLELYIRKSGQFEVVKLEEEEKTEIHKLEPEILSMIVRYLTSAKTAGQAVKAILNFANIDARVAKSLKDSSVLDKLTKQISSKFNVDEYTVNYLLGGQMGKERYQELLDRIKDKHDLNDVVNEARQTYGSPLLNYLLQNGVSKEELKNALEDVRQWALLPWSKYDINFKQWAEFSNKEINEDNPFKD